MGKTELNDLFWFEKDTIAAWLGYSSFSELEEERAIPFFKETQNGYITKGGDLK